MQRYAWILTGMIVSTTLDILLISGGLLALSYDHNAVFICLMGLCLMGAIGAVCFGTPYYPVALIASGMIFQSLFNILLNKGLGLPVYTSLFLQFSLGCLYLILIKEQAVHIELTDSPEDRRDMGGALHWEEDSDQPAPRQTLDKLEKGRIGYVYPRSIGNPNALFKKAPTQNSCVRVYRDQEGQLHWDNIPQSYWDERAKHRK